MSDGVGRSRRPVGRTAVLASALVAAGCGRCGPGGGATSLLVSVSFDAPASVDQLRFDVVVLGASLPKFPEVRPRERTGPLKSPETLRVFVRDDLAGEAASVFVCGLAADRGVVFGQDSARLERGREVVASVSLRPSLRVVRVSSDATEVIGSLRRIPVRAFVENPLPEDQEVDIVLRFRGSDGGDLGPHFAGTTTAKGRIGASAGRAFYFQVDALPTLPFGTVTVDAAVSGQRGTASCGPVERPLVWKALGRGMLGAVRVPSDAGGCVPVQFLADSDDGGRTDVVLEFDAGSEFQRATLGPGPEGPYGLLSPVGGAAHTLTWDSTADLGFTDNLNVRIRVRPRRLGVDTPGAAVAVPIRVDNRRFSLDAGVASGLGGTPVDLAVADFNRDGAPDVAAVADSSHIVRVLLWSDTGAALVPFTPISLATTARLGGVVAADFTGDGRTDLAVTDTANDQIAVFQGTGDGTFTPAWSTPLVIGGSPTRIVSGDFDRDGRPDAAVLLAARDEVRVGVWRPGVGFVASAFVPAAAEIASVAVADVDLDGKLDLVTAMPTATSRAVSFVLGDGTGGFGAPTGLTGNGAKDVAVGDINRDGRPDLVVANAGSNSIDVYHGLGRGLFAPAPGAATATSLASVTLADLDRDGWLDIAAGKGGGQDTATFVLRGAAGQFVPLGADFGVSPVRLAVADFDRDGNPDVVSVDRGAGTATVRLNRGTGPCLTRFEARRDFELGAKARALVTADFDADGHMDLATADTLPGATTVLLGAGAGEMERPRIAGAADVADPVGLAAADMDGNGTADLVVADHGQDRIHLLLGDGRGGFAAAPRPPFTAGNGPYRLVVADLDGNGIPDVATADDIGGPGDGTVSLLFGLGGGAFAPVRIVSVGENADGIAAGDLDGDGDLDLAVGDYTGNQVHVLRNDSAGGFSASQVAPVPQGPEDVLIADVDADAILDVAVACVSGDLAVLRGRGDGTLAPAEGVYLGGGPTSLARADFDGDGSVDLAVTSRYGNRVSLLTRPPGGGGLVAGRARTGRKPRGIAAADFDGDGVVDLATANEDSGTVSVIRGAGGG